MALPPNRFFASFILFLFLAIGLSLDGIVGSIIMLWGAKIALFLWFLPQIKAIPKIFRQWRQKNGLRTWKEFKKDLEEV